MSWLGAALALVALAALAYRLPAHQRWAVLAAAGVALGWLVGRRRPDGLPVAEREREAARDATERAVVEQAQLDHVERVEEVRDRAELPREERAARAARAVVERRG